jgi:hypothetical protein
MAKDINTLSKEIALFAAGGLIGILAGPLEIWANQNLGAITLASSLLILYGIGSIDYLITARNWLQMRANSKSKTVCLFAPFHKDERTSSWVDATLGEIQELLTRKKIRYAISQDYSVFKRYPIIINPYGGVYPERDISTLQSLEDIIFFVKNGGIYLNIADIPFFYAYDKNLNRRLDTTPLAGDFLPLPTFVQTLLTKRLHIFILGRDSGEADNRGVKRVIQISNPENNLFSEDVLINDLPGVYSPVVKIPFGKGYFIFSTLYLDRNNFEECLTRIIEPAVQIGHGRRNTYND